MMRDSPLRATIEGEELVIRIGVGTLAHAAENCERFYEYEKHAAPPYKQVTAPNELARDVRNELFREEEDGSSPISNLIDEAIVLAHDEGSLGFYEDDEKETAN